MDETPRTAGVLIRLTPQDREELNQRAREEGRSVQEYAISRLLDRPEIRIKRGGSRPRRQTKTQEELPLTG